MYREQPKIENRVTFCLTAGISLCIFFRAIEMIVFEEDTQGTWREESHHEGLLGPGVNNHGQCGRWAFAEFTEVYQIEADFEARVEAELNNIIDQVAKKV